MQRRDFMRYASSLPAGLLLSSRPVSADASGKKAYLHYSQQELDDAYSDAKWAPNMRELLGGQAAAGTRVRAAFPPRTASYGTQLSERLDVFSPAGAAPALPAMIFIHGGNWRVGTKESVSYLAPRFVKNDVVFIAPEYDTIPATTLPGMVEQCRRAILWVWRHARELGADPDRIHVGVIRLAGTLPSSCSLPTGPASARQQAC
ncbi:alpha/beta hydrolase [Pseudoduganella lutea]|nr:alpha/beta hydrolase [Pseudoduganella lutea]